MTTYTTEPDDRGIKQRLEIVELNDLVTVTISTSDTDRVINMDRMTVSKKVFDEVSKGIMCAIAEDRLI